MVRWDCSKTQANTELRIDVQSMFKSNEASSRCDLELAEIDDRVAVALTALTRGILTCTPARMPVPRLLGQVST